MVKSNWGHFSHFQEQVRAYKEKMKAINARAPKKVIEAKARKKRKVKYGTKHTNLRAKL